MQLRNHFRARTRVISFGLILAVVTACGAQQPTPASSGAAPKTNISVGFGLALGNPSNPFAWIGKELGYFDEENIDVDIVSTAANNAQADAMLLSGQLDIGIFGLDPILRPAADGKSLPGWAVFNVQSRSQYEGIVLDSSPIKANADLKGKKVGIPALGGTLEPYIGELLASVSLKPTDVEYLATGAGVPMGEALKRGDIDAGFGTRGQIGPLEAGGYPLRFLPRPAFAENFITGNVVARSDATPAKEAAVKGYLRAYAKSIVFTKANPEAAIRISWKMYADAKPKGVAEDVALKSAIATNVAYMSYIDKLEGKWGYMPPAKMESYAKFLGVDRKIPDLTKYYTNKYIDFVNSFDEAGVIAQAKSYKP
jgi:NitT/TauT family transport system substrate-binding protein